MRPATIWLALVMITTSAVAQDASTVMVRFDDGQGSGVIVHPDGYVLSAEHVTSHGPRGTITLDDGTMWPAVVVYDPPKNNVDECSLMKIQGGSDFGWSLVAADLPSEGSRVDTFGYPHGNWVHSRGEIEGRTQRRDTADPFKVEFRTHSGNSGGPLFNSLGEVIGIASTADPQTNSSGWIGPRSIATAISHIPGGQPLDLLYDHASTTIPISGIAALGQRRQLTADELASETLVAFTTPRCGDCVLFHQDLAAGRYTTYRVVVCEWQPSTGSWTYMAGHEATGISARDLYLRMKRGTGLSESAPFPIFWVEGTTENRTGYGTTAGGRGGLLGWFGDVLQMIFAGVFGVPDTPEVPAPGGEIDLGPAEELTTPAIASPATDHSAHDRIDEVSDTIGSVTDTVARLEAGYQEFQDAGVLTKVQAGLALKSEVQDAVAQGRDALALAQTVAHEVKEDPREWFMALLGGPLGLYLRRRLRNRVIERVTGTAT